jgi:hypothetical protein
MAAVRRHPGVVTLFVVVLVGAGIALWLAPFLGAILLAGLAVAVFVLVVPSLTRTTVEGPGYQYRDKSSPIVRDKRRD